MAHISSPLALFRPSLCVDRLSPSLATLAFPVTVSATGPYGRGGCVGVGAEGHRGGSCDPLREGLGACQAGPRVECHAGQAPRHTSRLPPPSAFTPARGSWVSYATDNCQRDSATATQAAAPTPRHAARALRNGGAGSVNSQSWKQRDTTNVQGRAKALLHKSWKPRDTTNVQGRAKALLRKLKGTDGTREQVVAVLDSWAAFQLDFPLLATKSAINELRTQQNWARLIQVCKWMLAKGHGRTFGTYSAMLEALGALQRDSEMDSLWALVLGESMETTPRALFAQAMRVYLARDRPLKVLEIYGSMDELGVRLDDVTLDVTLEALNRLGAHGHAEQLREQYSTVRTEWRYASGQRKQVNSFGRPREGQKI